MKKEDINKIKDIVDVWDLEQADESLTIIISKKDIKSMRKLIEELEDNEEIISKMAKRLKSFEEYTFNRNWISVNERLPSDEECSKFDNLHPLSRKFLCTIKIGDFNPEPRLLFYSKVFGWKYGADDYNEYVIAWQPLPEPYKEELL